ncbi:PE family protein [Colletotrichum tofieldiae]|nr:PE family protein [Colletotrichum tofieldiae]
MVEMRVMVRGGDVTVIVAGGIAGTSDSGSGGGGGGGGGGGSGSPGASTGGGGGGGGSSGSKGRPGLSTGNSGRVKGVSCGCCWTGCSLYTGASKAGGREVVDGIGVGATKTGGAGGNVDEGRFETAGRAGRSVANGSAGFGAAMLFEGLALGVSGLEGGWLTRFLPPRASLSLSDRRSTVSSSLLPELAALFHTPPAAFLTCTAYSSSDSASRSQSEGGTAMLAGEHVSLRVSGPWYCVGSHALFLDHPILSFAGPMIVAKMYPLSISPNHGP